MIEKSIWQKIEEWAEANPKKTIAIIATIVSAVFPKAQAVIAQIAEALTQ